MAKKKKKQNKPKQKQKKAQASNIKTMVCVECPREPFSIIKQEDCKVCQFHIDNFCHYTVPKTLIQIVSAATPMKFNRAYFQSASQEVGDSTRGYYLLTPIMQDVKSIQGYPNYTRLNERFLEGKYKKQGNGNERKSVNGDSIVPALYLASDESGNPDLIVEGQTYKRSEPFDIKGSWDLLYYLYDLVDLEGFADINIKGRWYKVRINQIESSKESLVLARNENKLVLGSIQ